MKMSYLYVVVLFFSFAVSQAFAVQRDPNHQKLVRGLVSEYYPNLAIIFIQKLDKDALIKKIGRPAIQEENKIEFNFPEGVVRVWLDKNNYISTARFIFKTSAKNISPSEKDLLKKYKNEIRNPDNQKNPHSNMSQIVDKNEFTGLGVTLPASDDASPRVSEIFLSEGYFNQ